MTGHSTSPTPTEDEHGDLTMALRYWLEEASAEETADVEAWLLAHPEWHARYAQLRQELKASTSWVDFSSDEVSCLIAKTIQAGGISEEHALRKHPSEQRRQSVPWRFPVQRLRTIIIGLSAMVLVAFGWAFWGSTHRGAEHRYTTGVGQRITVALADGSRVTLAPKTVVRVASSFGRSTRTVSVQGEAYFDVATAAGAPFIVQTGTIQTRVLGTRFVVVHNETQHHVSVAVETGKVAVSRPNTTPTVLTTGVVAAVTDSGITVFDRASLAPYTDWVEGQLTFHETPLPEVLATLSRWYGVQFQLADSSLTVERITGSLPYGSLEDMLKILKAMLPVSLTYRQQPNGSLLVTLGSARVIAPKPLRREHPSPPFTMVGR